MNNLHIYPSTFLYESRILKETKSLVNSDFFDKIFIAAIWARNLKIHEELDSKREVWRIPLRTGNLPDSTFGKIIKHIEWITRIFFRYRRKGIKFVNCHSLSTLPIGVLFKIFAKSKVIYDAHELETETEMSRIRKKISKFLERTLIHYADVVIVVSNSIGKWYKNQYNLRELWVIKNVPYQQNNKSQHPNILKEKFNVQDDEMLFIYQGALGSGRGIELLLNAFSKMEKKRHIVFMGYGALEDAVKEYENNFSNIHFHPAVKPEEVINYTKSADIGIHLIENTCLNHYYCLPNKVFEYIFSGLPLIVSDFPDMGKLIDENKCGWKVSVDEKSVVNLIENISKEEIKEKKNDVLKCRNDFGWHKEEEKLLKIYNKWFQ